MGKWLSKLSRRAQVSRDGSVYFVRRLHRTNKAMGIYLPKQILECLGLVEGDALVVWLQGDVICVKAIERSLVPERFIAIPPERPEDREKEQKDLQVLGGIQ